MIPKTTLVTHRVVTSLPEEVPGVGFHCVVRFSLAVPSFGWELLRIIFQSVP